MRRLLSLILALGLWVPAVPAAELATIAELPYFDVTQGFRELKQVNIYRAYDPTTETFYAFPSQLEIRDAAFRYRLEKGKIVGVLSATVTLGTTNSLDEREALEILRQRFANASLKTLAPAEAHYVLQMWGEERDLTPAATTILPFQPLALEARIEEPLSRVLLRDISSANNILAIALRYETKGVELDLNAQPVVTTRSFTIGRTFGISCVATPERFVDTSTGAVGCRFTDTIKGEKARRIQRYLVALAYYEDEIDGIVGPKTKVAIENFELDHKREPTGVASSGILVLLQETYQASHCTAADAPLDDLCDGAV